MQMLLDLLTNKILLSSLAGWAAAQIMKIVIHFIQNRRIQLSLFTADGGMPSAHSATVMGLCCAMGLSQGFGSPLFALSAVFAVVVLRDAVGVRRFVGMHAATINEISVAINKTIGHELIENDLELMEGNLNEAQGHTPLQVAVGSLVGIVAALLVHYLVKL